MLYLLVVFKYVLVYILCPYYKLIIIYVSYYYWYDITFSRHRSCLWNCDL